MFYYNFHIGDYIAHTNHLDPLEDIAYRRIIDWCYLNESALPDDVDEIAKRIRMRSHNECIAFVLQEFFTLTKKGYEQKRITEEIKKYKSKSEKAKKAAKTRWSATAPESKGVKVDAHAMRTNTERNANREPITNNHKPLDIGEKKKKTIFTPPNEMQVNDVFLEVGMNNDNGAEARRYIDYYAQQGWKLSNGNKMVDWKAAAKNWLRNQQKWESQK